MVSYPKIIAVDLDGTVFGADHKTIPPMTMSVLKRCIAHGSLLVPVTGRSKSIVPLEAFPSCRYLITSNGGYISDLHTNQVLRTSYIPVNHVKEAWNQIRHLVEQYHVVMELFVDDQIVVEQKVYDHFDLFHDKLPHFHKDYIYRGCAEYISSFDSYFATNNRHIVKVNFPGKSIRDCPEIKQLLRDLDLFELTSDGLNLELTCKGCNKGESLKWLSEHLHIPIEEVVAFGNGSNDVSMLLQAGFGVAMGNAADDVKAAADYTTLSNLEDGIADFLIKRFSSGYGLSADL